MGSLYAKDGVSNLLPSSFQDKYGYCANWMYVGAACKQPYGKCPHGHYRLDAITNEADYKAICDHVANTDGLWFNKDDVTGLTESAHLAKLGDASGPTGAN